MNPREKITDGYIHYVEKIEGEDRADRSKRRREIDREEDVLAGNSDPHLQTLHAQLLRVQSLPDPPSPPSRSRVRSFSPSSPPPSPSKYSTLLKRLARVCA